MHEFSQSFMLLTSVLRGCKCIPKLKWYVLERTDRAKLLFLQHSECTTQSQPHALLFFTNIQNDSRLVNPMPGIFFSPLRFCLVFILTICVVIVHTHDLEQRVVRSCQISNKKHSCWPVSRMFEHLLNFSSFEDKFRYLSSVST